MKDVVVVLVGACFAASLIVVALVLGSRPAAGATDEVAVTAGVVVDLTRTEPCDVTIQGTFARGLGVEYRSRTIPVDCRELESVHVGSRWPDDAAPIR